MIDNTEGVVYAATALQVHTLSQCASVQREIVLQGHMSTAAQSEWATTLLVIQWHNQGASVIDSVFGGGISETVRGFGLCVHTSQRKKQPGFSPKVHWRRNK